MNLNLTEQGLKTDRFLAKLPIQFQTYIDDEFIRLKGLTPVTDISNSVSKQNPKLQEDFVENLTDLNAQVNPRQIIDSLGKLQVSYFKLKSSLSESK